MNRLSQSERRHLEMAFESSRAIVKLAGLQDHENFAGFRKRIIEGELTFDEAVQIVVARYTVALPIKK